MAINKITRISFKQRITLNKTSEKESEKREISQNDLCKV